MDGDVEVVNVVKVFDRKIWIEEDIIGRRHVMIQHDDGESEPFTYCTFNYDHRYTSSVSIFEASESMAVALGADSPVERRFKPLSNIIKTEGVA